MFPWSSAQTRERPDLFFLFRHHFDSIRFFSPPSYLLPFFSVSPLCQRRHLSVYLSIYLSSPFPSFCSTLFASSSRFQSPSLIGKLAITNSRRWLIAFRASQIASAASSFAAKPSTALAAPLSRNK